MKEFEEEGRNKAWRWLITTTGIASQAMGIFAAGAFLVFTMGGFSYFGDAIAIYEDHKKNTIFRKCWPKQSCKDADGLPVDGEQNRMLLYLVKKVGINSKYIRIDCQTKIKNGNKDIDCTLLHSDDDFDLGISK